MPQDRSPPTPTPAATSDVELLTAYLTGDVGAFAALVKRHEPALLRHALALIRDRGRAEDAVQEALLRLARTPPGINSPVSSSHAAQDLGAWLHKVTRNQCLDMIRSETRRRSRESDQDIARAAAHADPALAGVDAEDTKSLVSSALQGLPVAQSEVITLRLFQEKSYAEIAEITGKKLGTVAWLISEGMKALSRELSPRIGAWE